MSSLQRPVREVVSVHDLDAERTASLAADGFSRTGRTARTVVKNGAMRVVLVSLGPGGELAEHQAPGPISIQPLSGRLVFRAEGACRSLEVGQLLTAEAGLAHSVHSEAGTTFLLTVADARSTEGGTR